MAMLVMVGHNTERYIMLDQLVVHFHHGNLTIYSIMFTMETDGAKLVYVCLCIPSLC